MLRFDTLGYGPALWERSSGASAGLLPAVGRPCAGHHSPVFRLSPGGRCRYTFHILPEKLDSQAPAQGCKAASQARCSFLLQREKCVGTGPEDHSSQALEGS